MPPLSSVTAETMLAMMLLSVPPGVPSACPAPQEFPALREAVHKVAVCWEILDERETRYVLTKPEDFCTDLNMLRRRHAELQDAPRLAECYRFPERTNVNELVRFNRTFRRQIDERRHLELDRSDQFRQILVETDRLYQIWDAVRDARCEFYYVTVRRNALRKLHDLLGPEDFALGQLPPSVPLWHFQNLRP